MAEITAFLGIEIDPTRLPRILEHCSFGWMKANGDRMAPLVGALWSEGFDAFYNKGTNGRWREELTPSEVEAYEARAVLSHCSGDQHVHQQIHPKDVNDCSKHPRRVVEIHISPARAAKAADSMEIPR